MAEQLCNVDYLTAIWPLLPYLRDGTAEQTTGPIGNIYKCQYRFCVMHDIQQTTQIFRIIQSTMLKACDTCADTGQL